MSIFKRYLLTAWAAVGGGGGVGPASGDGFLLEDGVSFFLMEDGSFFLQES